MTHIPSPVGQLTDPVTHPVRRLGSLAASASWGVFWGGWAALLPGIKIQAGLDAPALGLALCAIPIGAVPAMLVTGTVYDRYGRRTLGISLVLFAVAVVLPGLATGKWSLAAALLAVGATSGAIEVALNAATAATEAATGRRLFHLVHAVTPIAMIVAAPAVGAARQAGAAPLPILLVVGALVAVSAVVDGWSRVPAPADRSAGDHSARFRLVPTGWVLLYGLAGATVLFVENAVEQWSAVLLDHQRGTGPFVASLGPAGYLAALAVGRMVAHRYGDGLTPGIAVTIAGIGGAAGISLAANASAPGLAIAGFVLAGLGNAAALPTLLTATGRGAEANRRGAAVATVTTVSYLGFLTSPAAVGSVAGAAGLSGALGMVAALAGALAGAVLLGRVVPLRRMASQPGRQA